MDDPLNVENNEPEKGVKSDEPTWNFSTDGQREEVILRWRKDGFLIPAFLILGLTVLCMWIAVQQLFFGVVSFVFYVPTFFLGVVALALFWTIVSKRPGAVIREDGFWVNCEPFNEVTIPWQDIEKIVAFDIHEQECLGLAVKDLPKLLKSLDLFTRAQIWLNVKLSFPTPIGIPTYLTPFRNSELVQIIKRHYEGPVVYDSIE